MDKHRACGNHDQDFGEGPLDQEGILSSGIENDRHKQKKKKDGVSSGGQIFRYGVGARELFRVMDEKFQAATSFFPCSRSWVTFFGLSLST